MTTGFLMPCLPTVAFDANGEPISGAKLQFYLTGTTTPTPVYANAGLTTPLTNPVVANASGLFPAIYLDPTVTYRAQLQAATGAVIADIDPASTEPLAATQGQVNAGSAGNVYVTPATLAAWTGVGGAGATGAAGGDLTGTYPNPTIGAGKVGNTKLANMSANTVKANLTGSAAAPQDVTLAALNTALSAAGGGSGSSIAGNGYTTLPNGLIIQWGSMVQSLTNPDGTLLAVSFPLVFPNALFTVVCTDLVGTVSAGNDVWVRIQQSSLSASGFSADLQGSGTGGLNASQGVNWIAFGH